MGRFKLLGTSALCSAAAIGIGAPALAQDRDAQGQPLEAARNESEALPATDAEPPREGEVVVTGSRLKRNEFTSSTPIQVIDPELAGKQGQLDTASIVQSSSVAAGSSQLTGTISSNLTASNGGRGAATVSLRGLGAERTLVLLNGRRAGPAGTRGGVSSFDLNVLPQSIVSSVEILKSGASSVYGSDAIAGVVNILTKRNTRGVEFDGYVAVPLGGGGEEYRASATYGKVFDRGHFLASLDYYKREELKRGQRKYLDCPEEYIFTPTGERADIIDPRTGSPRCEDSLWGEIWLYDYQGANTNLRAPNGQRIRRIQFDYDGNLGRFVPSLAATSPATTASHFRAPPGYFPVNYDRASKSIENAMHPFVSDATFIPETERITLYADASFELTDNIEWYGEFLRNRRETYQNSFRQFFQYLTFTSDFNFNDGVRPGVGDPLSAGFTGAVGISPLGLTDHNDSSQRVDYTRAVGGFRGDFGGWLDGWSWDAHAQYSRSDGRYTNDQIFADAIDVSLAPGQNFRTGSCAGTLTVIRRIPCVDINFTKPELLAGNFTQAERNFLFGTETGRTIYTQLFGEASATGTLFTLPAGPVRAALGIAWRRDRINDTPGAITLAGNAWLASAAGITAGKSETKEAFAEAEIPLIHDAPLIKSFTLSGSARVTSVGAVRAVDGKSSSDNGNWTYSAGANWEVTDWLRLRGTYGTSFRAPALFQQFLADQTSFRTQRDIDPCIEWGQKLALGTLSKRTADNCAADGIAPTYAGGSLEAVITTGGGIGVLEAETSTAKTASIILTPRFGFLPNTRFSFAVDYFDIHVKGEIAQIGARQVISQCYDSEFFPNEPLCDLFERAPANAAIPGAILTVQDALVNVNSQRNKGVDFTANIRQDLGRWGNLSLLAQATWQTRDTIALFTGTEQDNNGEAGEPKWVGDFNLVWNKGDTSLFYGLDYVAATSNEADFIRARGALCQTNIIYGNYCVDVTAPARFYHSASITQKLSGFEITAGVSNLLDTKPPRTTISGGTLNSGVVTTIGQSLFASQYDYAGRRAFINVKSRF